MKIIKPHNRYSTTTYWRRVNGGILSCILIEHKCNKLGAKLPEKISPQTQNQNRLVMSETSVLAELPFFSATDDELLGIAEEDLLLVDFKTKSFLVMDLYHFTRSRFVAPTQNKWLAF